MGHAARAYAAEPQHEQHAAPNPYERAQPELPRGEVDRDHLVPWLAGATVRNPKTRRAYPAASKFFPPGERNVLTDAVSSCTWKTGRWEKSHAAIAKSTGLHKDTVRKIIGGTGLKGAQDAWEAHWQRHEDGRLEWVVTENARSSVVMEGTLSELFERRWYSPNEAPREFPKDNRHHAKGLMVKWLQFTTIEELVAFGERRRARQKKRRIAAGKRTWSARTEQALNPTHSPPSGPLADQDTHSKTRLSGALPERLTPQPPPAPLRVEPEKAAAPAAHSAAPSSGAPPSRTARPAAEESHEDGSAPAGARAPLPVAVAARLGALARTFERLCKSIDRPVFEMGFRGIGSSLPAVLSNRWRELVGVAEPHGVEDAPRWACEQLEAAAYASTRARRGAWARAEARGMAPYTFANLERVLELAHYGRELAAEAHEAALRREARRAAWDAEAPRAGELREELRIDVGPVADAIAARDAEVGEPAKLREMLRLAWMAAEEMGDLLQMHAIDREFRRAFGRSIRQENPS